jgi:hypothetical protein
MVSSGVGGQSDGPISMMQIQRIERTGGGTWDSSRNRPSPSPARSRGVQERRTHHRPRLLITALGSPAGRGGFPGRTAGEHTSRFLPERGRSPPILGGGGGNRTRVHGFEKRATARDFRCQDSILRRIRCPFESPGVPYSPLESTPVLETVWKRRHCSQLTKMDAVVGRFTIDIERVSARAPQ